MKLSHRIHQHVLIIVIEDKALDALTTPAFKTEVNKLLEENLSKHLIIDLSNLQFIDSAGFGSILSILKTLTKSEGDIKLSCMSKPIRAIFELVCMHKIFQIFNTTEEALQACLIINR